ncbi:MAG TPA: gliding motility protein GldN [Paludibacter sp.]|nr:gliding motility protein GldN [Paludibacter sp.]
MKKYWIACLTIVMVHVPGMIFAQANQVPFFDSKGMIRIQTTEMDAMADTIAVVNHRADDVVWSRVVYRVIDMREKQNYQLYFPLRPNDEYKSLFRVMLEAIGNGVSVYKRNSREIKPSFADSLKLEGAELSKTFAYNENPDYNLLQVNPVTQQIAIENTQYRNYVKNQIKFLIQEIVLFDKHTSRMYSKIMAIAPLYALQPDNQEAKESMAYFRNSVLCWFAFDELRPYLAKQYVIPNGNETQRLTYDDFFAQKLYSSYLLGDSNMFNRMLLEYTIDPLKIKKEQNRIETELLNTEQDIWEY